ncbi:MAG TPA: putative lipid II flippase FtsW [Actinomycetota bacterium]|nr:putative lipid II flippase FtsW [Actinomycetota bacterium]
MHSEAAVAVPRLRLVRPGERSPAAIKARAERSMRRTLTMLSLSVAILTMAGLVMVLSASSVSAFAEYGSSFLFFKRQLMYAVMGSAALLAAARLPYRVWQRAWVPLFGVSVLLLVLVLHPSAGTTVGGAARWIQVGPVSLQPSELAKFAVVAACASILALNVKTLESDPGRWIVPLAFIVGGVSLLILFQPDLGTMMVIALTSFVLLFVAGVRLRLLLSSAVLSTAVGLALIMGEGYRRARFLSFLHPWADPRNTGYQIVQSLIALGSGHVFGVGLGASRQKWMYVPNAHTDFIFSILGEELGLIGELIVLALFGALVYAGIRIALRAPDAFGRLLAGGITAWLGLQALVNLGAVTGLLPITGVPLPFVSFGGSSLIVSLGAVGVLLSIGRAALAAGPSGSRTREPGWHRGS